MSDKKNERKAIRTILILWLHDIVWYSENFKIFLWNTLTLSLHNETKISVHQQ